MSMHGCEKPFVLQVYLSCSFHTLVYFLMLYIPWGYNVSIVYK